MNEDKEVTDIYVGHIENDINRCKELIKDKHKEWIGLTNQKAIANVLNNYEKIQNEIKELEAKLEFKQFGDLDNIQFEDYMNEFIPKRKIKDKIDELKNKLKFIACSKDCTKCFDEKGNVLYRGRSFFPCFAYHQIKILQELLREENK